MLKITASVEQRELDRYFKKLDKNRGKPLRDRAQRTTNAAARLLVPPLRAAAPKGPARRQASGPILMLGRKRRKTMRTSAGTKLLKQRGGEDIRPTWAGYKAFHAVFLLGGTRSHSLATRNLAAGARGRWTTRGNWRSGFARFADGEVRPLGGITVSGITPRDYVEQVWNANQRNVYGRISKDVFDVR